MIMSRRMICLFLALGLSWLTAAYGESSAWSNAREFTFETVRAKGLALVTVTNSELALDTTERCYKVKCLLTAVDDPSLHVLGVTNFAYLPEQKLLAQQMLDNLKQVEAGTLYFCATAVNTAGEWLLVPVQFFPMFEKDVTLYFRIQASNAMVSGYNFLQDTTGNTRNEFRYQSEARLLSVSEMEISGLARTVLLEFETRCQLTGNEWVVRRFTFSYMFSDFRRDEAVRIVNGLRTGQVRLHIQGIRVPREALQQNIPVRLKPGGTAFRL